jgi:hypothetical protein
MTSVKFLFQSNGLSVLKDLDVHLVLISPDMKIIFICDSYVGFLLASYGKVVHIGKRESTKILGLLGCLHEK